MIAEYRKHGYRIRPILRRLIEDRKTFMHTINHPTIDLIERLAVLALDRLGLIQTKSRRAKDLPDELAARCISPVFGAIARRIDVAPYDSFRLAVGATRPGDSRDVPLGTQVERWHRLYATLDKTQLHTPEIEPIVGRLQALLA